MKRRNNCSIFSNLLVPLFLFVSCGIDYYIYLYPVVDRNPDPCTSYENPETYDINSAVAPVLADYLGEHPDDRLTCLNLVSVFRKLERTGDHITNMAEEIIFFVNAKVLKHQGNTDEHYI